MHLEEEDRQIVNEFGNLLEDLTENGERRTVWRILLGLLALFSSTLSLDDRKFVFSKVEKIKNSLGSEIYEHVEDYLREIQEENEERYQDQDYE